MSAPGKHRAVDALAPLPWRGLTGVIASVSVFAIAQGLSYPYFTFLMQRQGLSPGLIGLSAAMTPLGLIASAAFVPAAVRLGGARPLAVTCASFAALLFLLIGVLQNDLAWFAIRFLIGIAINPLYVLGEVWMIALAPPARRGRILGMFNALTGIGYAAGPLALAAVGSEGWPPLLIGVGGFMGCAALLFLTTRDLRGFEDSGERAKGVMWFWTAAPALLVAVVVSSVVQISGLSLLPVYGAGHGLSEASNAALVTAMMVGNILLQLPLGLAAERLGARPMIVACAVLNGVCAVLLALTIGGNLVWPVVVVMGGVGYGIYTMAVIELGERFTGSTLVTGNAAFALMWGVGGIAGPPATGLVMQVFGLEGLPVVTVVLSVVLAAFLLYRQARRGRRDPARR